MKRILNWGCGLQSTTLAVMSALGDIPKVDLVIHADLGAETKDTVRIRDYYCNWLRENGLNVQIIRTTNIFKNGMDEHKHIPFWTDNGSPLRRKCTKEIKIRPLRRFIRNYYGYPQTKSPHPPKGEFNVILGIGVEETRRAKLSDVKFITHTFPLIEKSLTRQDCKEYLEEKQLPIPPKSSCIMCPYRNAVEYLDMKKNNPIDFLYAVEFDNLIRSNPIGKAGGVNADRLYIFRNSNWKPEPLESADLEYHAEIIKNKKRT